MSIFVTATYKSVNITYNAKKHGHVISIHDLRVVQRHINEQHHILSACEHFSVSLSLCLSVLYLQASTHDAVHVTEETVLAPKHDVLQGAHIVLIPANDEESRRVFTLREAGKENKSQ